MEESPEKSDKKDESNKEVDIFDVRNLIYYKIVNGRKLKAIVKISLSS